MDDLKSLRKSLRTNFDPGPRDYLNRASLRARQAVHLPAWYAGASLEKPIFVVGAPRSGTSMLYAVLRSSGRVAHWPGEAHEVWEHDYHPALREWDSNVLTAADVEDGAARRIRREFFLVTGKSRRLIDKTPRNVMRIPFIDTVFPDARYVFLKRDGRDNVNSLVNAWRTPRYRTYKLPEPHRIEGPPDRSWWKFVLYPGWRDDMDGPLEVVCARQWVFSNDLALEASQRVEPHRWFEVAYESLASDPPSEVGHILEWLNLPYEDGVRARAEEARTRPVNVVTPPERGKWRKENPTEIAAILPLIRPTMEALGYSTDED